MDQGILRSILVVDDDVMILRFLRETLTSFVYCEVDTSPNAEYAFELALRKHYDLFLFDVAMPVIDGIVLYSLINKVYEHTSPIARTVPPLLLMSGNDDRSRIAGAMKEPGVRGFLSKPFTIDRLLLKLDVCLPPGSFRPQASGMMSS